MPSITTTFPVTPRYQRLAAVALVLLLHAGLGFVWLMQPAPPRMAVNELSVSVAMPQAESVRLPAQPSPPRIEHKAQPAPKQAIREARPTQPVPAVAAAQQAVNLTAAAAPPAVSASPAAPAIESEPDYTAAYLNNPRPAYPFVARRMGWQGRVILHVEVLAEGACGAVSVLHSSGHEVLDNAAMMTVRSWRFLPARRAGHAVTQWFNVPIVFSFEDNAA